MVTPRASKANAYIENWDNFGKNIKEFVETHQDIFADFRPHIIAGFSTGGAIVSYILAAYARDIYGKNLRAEGCFSTLTIPVGLSNKKYDSPCFGITEEGDSQDIKEFETFIITIENYMNKYNLSKINILLIDDNITGSRRLLYYYDSLTERLGDKVAVKLLSYIKNDNFSSNSRIIKIRDDFPADYFIMPWHEACKHPANKINVRPTDVDIFFHVKKGFDEDFIYEYIYNIFSSSGIKQKNILVRNNYPSIGNKSSRYQWNITVNIANIDMTIGRVDKGLVFTYAYHLEYAPKSCLRGGKAFDFAFCERPNRGEEDLCHHCAFINCNKNILKNILKSPFIDTAQAHKDVDDKGRYSGASPASIGAINTFLNRFILDD